MYDIHCMCVCVCWCDIGRLSCGQLWHYFSSSCRETKKKNNKTTCKLRIFSSFFFDYHYWNVNRKKYSMCAAEEEEKEEKEKKWRNLAALALAQQFSIQENKRSEKDKLSNGEKREQNFFLQRECVYHTIYWMTHQMSNSIRFAWKIAAPSVRAHNRANIGRRENLAKCSTAKSHFHNRFQFGAYQFSVQPKKKRMRDEP